MTPAPTPLPRGIASVVQPPSDAHGKVDVGSLERLVQDAVQAGIAGLPAPGAAGETAYLSAAERKAVVRRMVGTAAARQGVSHRVRDAQTLVSSVSFWVDVAR